MHVSLLYIKNQHVVNICVIEIVHFLISKQNK